MSDTRQKIIIALVGTILGGAIGFGSEYFFFKKKSEERKSELLRQISAAKQGHERDLEAQKKRIFADSEASKLEFARQERYIFLKEIDDDRKNIYIDIRKTLLQYAGNPSSDNFEILEDTLNSFQIIVPRVPANIQLLTMKDEIWNKISDAKANSDQIQDIIESQLDKYFCVMNASLSSIEEMLQYTIEEGDFPEPPSQDDSELTFLEYTCLETENRG